MGLAVITHYSGLNNEDATRLSKAGHAACKRTGGLSFSSMKKNSGTNIGEWFVIWRYRDWAHHAEVTAALAKDKKFQEAVAELLKLAKITNREYALELDL